MGKGKTMTAYVIQDCVESGEGDDYGFTCDAQVRLALYEAKALAWDKFAEHYWRLSGHKPSDEIRKAFDDSISSCPRCYTTDVTESHTVTVEILERRLA